MNGKNVEKWLPINGYENHYEVSSFGRIKSFKGNQKILNTKLKTGAYLYPGVNLYLNGKRKHFHVHVLVLKTFVGPCPLNMEACHADGDRTNCYLSNLRWDSKSGNYNDRRLHGTSNRGKHYNVGEQNGSYKQGKYCKCN